MGICNDSKDKIKTKKKLKVIPSLKKEKNMKRTIKN